MDKPDIEVVLSELPADQARILYLKCQGWNYEKIGAEMNIAFQTVTREMAFVYEKLGPIIGIDENTHPRKRMRILETRVCDALTHLIGGNPDLLTQFPLRRPSRKPLGATSEVSRNQSPDPAILSLVLYDEFSRQKRETEQDPEVVTGEPVDDEPEGSDAYESSRENRPRNERDLRGTPSAGNAGAASIRINPPIIALIGFLVLILCLYLGRSALRNFINPQPAATATTHIQSPTTTRGSTSTPQSTDTPAPSATASQSPTPPATLTATIPPTAVPLPVQEDFSHAYSDSWEVSGAPFLAKNVNYAPYSGVLTANGEETFTMSIGNTAWTNYTIFLKAMPQLAQHAGVTFAVAVRVRDAKNKVVLECEGSMCNWVVYKDGKRDVMLKDQKIIPRDKFTLVADGNSFVVNAEAWGSHYESSITFTSKYKGEYLAGGVQLEMTTLYGHGALDQIEIQRFP